VSNRSANRENTYTNLGAWCEKYREDTGIKVHPSSVPVDLVLEDLIGYIAILMAHDKGTATAFDALNERVKELEKQVHELNVQFVELESKTGNTNFETADDIQERWKQQNNPEKNLNKNAKVKK
jgi:hypothetical protein